MINMNSDFAHFNMAQYMSSIAASAPLMFPNTVALQENASLSSPSSTSSNSTVSASSAFPLNVVPPINVSISPTEQFQTYWQMMAVKTGVPGFGVPFMGTGVFTEMGNCMNSQEMTPIIIRCEQLEKSEDIESLRFFFSSLPNPIPLNLAHHESFLRARAQFCFLTGEYTEVYKILESHQFSAEHHEKLQTMWFEARYAEVAKQKGRTLIPVDRHRIRKRFPLPSTIWDGKQKAPCFDEVVRSILKKSFCEDPYPNPAKKKKLATMTGLEPIQVGNWFKNRRQRIRAAAATNRGSETPMICQQTTTTTDMPKIKSQNPKSNDEDINEGAPKKKSNFFGIDDILGHKKSS